MEGYGLTELGGPGVGFDCKAQNGIHLNEDHFLAEIVDPITLEPLPLGGQGELVFTLALAEFFASLRGGAVITTNRVSWCCRK